MRGARSRGWRIGRWRVHTSTNSAAYFEGKQTNVSAADAKKNTFLYGGVAKAEVRERTCQGRGLRHRSKACEVLTTEVRGLAMTNKAGSGCAASTLHRCSTAPARALRQWVPLVAMFQQLSGSCKCGRTKAPKCQPVLRVNHFPSIFWYVRPLFDG